MVRKAKALYGLPLDWQSEKSEFAACDNLGDFTILDNIHNPEPVIDRINGSEEEKGMYNFLEKCYYTEKFQRVNNTFINQMAVSPVFDQILAWFRRKTKESDAEFPLKYAHLSGHASTVNPFLNILDLGVSNLTCMVDDLYNGRTASNPNCSKFPIAASNVIWELILKPGSENRLKKSDDDYIVKFSYDGEYLDHCKTGKVDRFGEYYCELGDFYEVVRTRFVTDEDYLGYCGFKKPGGSSGTGKKSSTWVRVLVALVVVFGVIFGLLVVLLIRTVRRLRRLTKIKKEN